MRLIPFAAASIAVTAVIFVKADEDTQIDQTVLDYYFGGDEAKYQKAVQQIFKKMDFNQDGVVTESDLDSLFAENRNDLTMFEPFSANRLQTVTGVKVAVMDFDENEDEVVDLNEFQQGMKKFENEKVHTDLFVCENAQSVVNKCQDDEPNVMTTNHLVVKIHHGFCKAHIAKLFNNTVETCILAMQSDCSKVNQCYSKQFRDSLVTISNTPSRTRRSLHKRADANTWKLAFWISMIVVGVPAFFSVIGIPFYLLILFVASNTIDFDQLASRDW